MQALIKEIKQLTVDLYIHREKVKELRKELNEWQEQHGNTLHQLNESRAELKACKVVSISPVASPVEASSPTIADCKAILLKEFLNTTALRNEWINSVSESIRVDTPSHLIIQRLLENE